MVETLPPTRLEFELLRLFGKQRRTQYYDVFGCIGHATYIFVVRNLSLLDKDLSLLWSCRNLLVNTKY